MATRCGIRGCAAENAALAAELARVKSFVEAGERDALLLEVDAMRVQLLHLDDTIKRLSAAPQVFTTPNASKRYAGQPSNTPVADLVPACDLLSWRNRRTTLARSSSGCGS